MQSDHFRAEVMPNIVEDILGLLGFDDPARRVISQPVRDDSVLVSDLRYIQKQVSRMKDQIRRLEEEKKQLEARLAVALSFAPDADESMDRLRMENERLQRKYDRQREATVNTYRRVTRLIEALKRTEEKSNHWKIKYKSEVKSLRRSVSDARLANVILNAEKELMSFYAGCWMLFDNLASDPDFKAEFNAVGWALLKREIEKKSRAVVSGTAGRKDE